MILCLDVGNSQIYGGVFKNDEILLRFRKRSTAGISSDEMGLFLKSVLRENGIVPEEIQDISICTVVPDLVHSLGNCCKKYFRKKPFFLQAGVKTGLKINYRNPLEVGADRIANAVAGSHLYPNKNLIIIDFGTATTFCAISKEKQYLGGVIHAGLRISMEALEQQTAKLPKVEIRKPESVIGRSTVESIQAGLFFGHLAIVKETQKSIEESLFKETPVVIGTGGFSRLFEKEKIFDYVEPDLVLKGLYLSLNLNSKINTVR